MNAWSYARNCLLYEADPGTRGQFAGEFTDAVRGCHDLVALLPCSAVWMQDAPAAFVVDIAAGRAHAPLMVIVVTRVGGDGSVLARSVHTASRSEPGWWQALVEQASLAIPRPYRPQPEEPVYFIRPGDQEAQVAERDLQEPLRELVIAVLAEGDC